MNYRPPPDRISSTVRPGGRCPGSPDSRHDRRTEELHLRRMRWLAGERARSDPSDSPCRGERARAAVPMSSVGADVLTDVSTTTEDGPAHERRLALCLGSPEHRHVQTVRRSVTRLPPPTHAHRSVFSLGNRPKRLAGMLHKRSNRRHFASRASTETMGHFVFRLSTLDVLGIHIR